MDDKLKKKIIEKITAFYDGNNIVITDIKQGQGHTSPIIKRAKVQFKAKDTLKSKKSFIWVKAKKDTQPVKAKKPPKLFKIMYHFVKREHIRVFEPFVPTKGIDQKICTPNFISKRGVNLSRIKYDIAPSFKFALKKFWPDVVVQCNNSKSWHHKMRKYGMKIVYIGHGVWDGSPTNIKRSFNPFWSQFDLLIGGIPTFKHLLVENAKVDPNKIVLNALPQFDVCQ